MRKILFGLCLLWASYAYAKETTIETPLSIDEFPRQVEYSSGAAVTMSMEEAIFLAIRTNPNVQSSQLSHISQKFSVWVQEWHFLPQYSLTGQVGSHSDSINPGVSLNTPIGTQMALTSTNEYSNDQLQIGLALQVVQPLLRGFGKAIVEAALNNARDSEVISRLNIEGVLRNTVTSVINAYLDVLSAEQRVKIDEGALKRAQRSVEQTRLFIKAGHKAGNEIVTVQANAASAKSQLENDRNGLLQARYALLSAIGIDPNAKIKFTTLDVQKLSKKYQLTSAARAKKLILENDIQYQTEEIVLHGPTKRSLMTAEDNTRWQLNVVVNAATTNSSGGNQNVNNLFNGANQQKSAALVLQVPIDDQLAKQAVLNAKIALKEAELKLTQDRWSKETSAINIYNSVVSAERSLIFAKDAERLQEKTYNVNYQKYLHGLIDSLELQSALVSLIQAQQTSLRAHVDFVKAQVNMDLLIGNTLNTWDIKVRM